MKEDPIDAKLVASNFAVDAFTTAAFSMSMTSDAPIKNFDKVPFVKSMIDFLTPSVAVLIPKTTPRKQARKGSAHTPRLAVRLVRLGL